MVYKLMMDEMQSCISWLKRESTSSSSDECTYTKLKVGVGELGVADVTINPELGITGVTCTLPKDWSDESYTKFNGGPLSSAESHTAGHKCLAVRICFRLE